MDDSGWAIGVDDGKSFDHYARVLQRLLDVPTSLVSLVQADRQVFPGAAGLEEPESSTRQTPLSHSFCQYVVLDEQPLVISDARIDPRLATNPAIADFGVIAYLGCPLHDDQGRTVGSLCAIDTIPRTWRVDDVAILEDLAQACSAELQARWQHAREGELLARTIVESVDVALAFYDSESRLVMANGLAEQAFQLATAVPDGSPSLSNLVRRADNLTPVPCEEQIIPRALRGDLRDHEMEWIGPPGSQRAIVAAAQEVRHTDGSPWGTLVVAHDVTELAHALLVKDEFIATVSHELRTPLTSILGYLELVSDELGPDGFVAEALATITRNATRLQERVQLLLDTADRRRQLDVCSSDLSLLACRVLDTFAEEAKRTGIVLTVDASQPHHAVVDVRQVEQALENLVSNSLKYSRAGGRTVVTVTGDETSTQLSVCDDGIGMSPDEIIQACETFWRSERAHRGAVPGFGIGLTLVKNVVGAHRGRLDIQSQPDQGTTVTLSFPRDSALSAIR